MGKKKMVALRLDDQTIETIKSIAKRFTLSQADVIAYAVKELAKKTNTNVLEIKTLHGIYEPFERVLKSAEIKNINDAMKKQEEIKEDNEESIEDILRSLDEM